MTSYSSTRLETPPLPGLSPIEQDVYNSIQQLAQKLLQLEADIASLVRKYGSTTSSTASTRRHPTTDSSTTPTTVWVEDGKRLRADLASFEERLKLIKSRCPTTEEDAALPKEEMEAIKKIKSAHMSLRSILGLSPSSSSSASDELELKDNQQTPAFTLQLQIYIIEKHHQDLCSTLRSSLLNVRAHQELLLKQARNQLLELDAHGIERRNRQKKDQQYSAEAAAAKSADFTSSLMRTRQLMYSEIEKSAEALETLRNSTNTLRDTDSELQTYGSTVKVGRKIITKQLQRERTDKILIFLGVCFFFLCVFYVVQRRLAPFLFWWRSSSPLPGGYSSITQLFQSFWKN